MAADKALKAVGVAGAKKKKGMKLNSSNFNPDGIGFDEEDEEDDSDFSPDDTFSDDSDEDYIPTYDRQRRRKLKKQAAKGKDDEPTDAIEFVTQGLVASSKGIKQRDHSCRCNRLHTI